MPVGIRSRRLNIACGIAHKPKLIILDEPTVAVDPQSRNNISCFFQELYLSDELKQFSYEALYRLLEGRKTNPQEGSYTTYLFEKGLDKILKKVGEECTEVIIAGRKEDREETVYEIADLCYHVMVLMVQMGITVEDVTRELEKRHVVDHKVKQERMQ